MKGSSSARPAILITLLLGASLAVSPPAGFAQLLSTDPAGVKETKRLIKEAEALIEKVEVLQNQIRTTLASHSALFNASHGDLRKPYRQLDEEIETCGTRRAAVRRQLVRTTGRAEEYFRGWSATLPAIASEDLRARSASRAEDARARFDGILEAGRRAAAEFEPLLGQLRDQWTYLGHDLNPSGIASLRPDAEELNREGLELHAAIEESLRQARDYVDSIRNVQPPPPPPPAEPVPPATEEPVS